MKLSVIIVNYNVEYFLEQCLYSVEKAIKGIDADVFVVDNVSVDGSCAMVKAKFPWVKLIENKENVGFSIANNQAMRISTAEYSLLLNPDTVVQEDTFHQVIDFMDSHLDAGGLGVKMVDGKGKYLPESKRGLPTPWVAFSKMFGLSSVFPKSKKFNRYYLGNLSPNETHEIEILSGAFMMMRKTALDKVGLLDEAFFMYGEDIDLSWRIILGGYKNYYYPHTRIIHYKGESTKKGSLNYVFVFYQAMIIFAKKHFSAQHANTFTFFINMAIYLRAAVAIVNRFIQSVWLPALDFSVVFLGLWFAKDYYAEYTGIVYDFMLSRWAFAAYTLIWMLSVLYSGGYDKPVRLLRILSGTLIGTGIILVVYALMPESLRFSRALILLGAGVAGLWFLLSRFLLHALFKGRHAFKGHTRKRFALVGSLEEIDRIQYLLRQTSFDPPFTVKVNPSEDEDNSFVGHLSQLKEIIRVHRINEVVFSGKDLEAKTIIDQMSDLDHHYLDFKIAPAESLSLIGSNSIDSSGDLFILDTNSILKPANLRNKRTFDLLVCLLTILVFPIALVVQKQPLGFIKNWVKVAVGKSTWIGYAAMKESHLRLPKIKNGILSVRDGVANLPKDQDLAVKLNMVYARNYKVGKDLKTLLSSWRNLGT